MNEHELENFIGTKVIKACKMSKHTFEGQVKKVPSRDDEEDIEGYVVRYEDGYTSWSPKEAFEKAYRKLDQTTEKFIMKNNVL